MTAPGCDRACGCRAEVGALEKRLRESHTFAWLVACGVNHHHGCTPGDPCIRCERDRCRAEVERLLEQERLAKERAEAVEASYHRMLPVYEAAVAYWRAVRGCAETRSDPDSDPDAERAIIQAEDDTFQTLMQRCRAAALAADREGEGEE